MLMCTFSRVTMMLRYGHSMHAGLAPTPLAPLSTRYGELLKKWHGASLQQSYVGRRGVPLLCQRSRGKKLSQHHHVGMLIPLACRGGIQIAFPTFNKSRELPQHGFMDKMQWSLADSSIGPKSAEDPAPHVTFVTRSNEQTMKLWPHQFEASYSVSCLASVVEQARQEAWAAKCLLSFVKCTAGGRTWQHDGLVW